MADKKDELQAKLRRLGVVKGARDLKPSRELKPAPPVDEELVRPFASRPPQHAPDDDNTIQPLEMLLPGGQLVETAVGRCFVLDHVYALEYRHGADQLADLLRFSPAAAAPFVQDVRLAQHDFRDFLFLDTETTGLAGTGTLAFMVDTANITITLLYSKIGTRINKDLLHGKRAEYGKQILSQVASQLQMQFGKRGFQERNIHRMMQFAELFPDYEIVSQAATQLSWRRNASGIDPVCRRWTRTNRIAST